MPRNAIAIGRGTRDDDESTVGRKFDPFGFLDLVPNESPTHNSRPMKRQRRPSNQPPQDIDRIRDDVNQWMDDNDFGDAGVPDVDLDMIEANDDVNDTDMGPENHMDTHDHVENLLSSNNIDIDIPEIDEPIPPDPVAETILHNSAVNANEDELEYGDNDEIFRVDTSETARISPLADDTEEISHIPHEVDLSDFQNALGLWVNLHSISRAAYSHLVEVFQLAKDIHDIQSIPRRKDTLKAHVCRSLPLGRLRQSNVTLDMKRLPTRSKSTEKVLSVDMEDTLSTLLSSSRICNQIYKGMAHHIKAQVRNPWEAPWWGESVRTSSGKFHHYPNKEPIFPSDFVVWQCRPGITDHTPDRCTADCERTHIGRVVWSGLDIEDSVRKERDNGTPLLLIQRVYQRGSYIPFHLITLTAMMSQSPTTPDTRELVIVEDNIVSMHPDRVIHQLSGVHLDYKFCSKDIEFRPQPCTAPYTVRYIWNESKMQVRELKYSSPHRAELELRSLGRKYVVDNFAKREMVSLPLHMFVDAFGLYRNMYRSIEGLYFFPQFFDMRVRNRRSSVITATLGPFGAQRSDIFRTLAHISRLENGTELVVNGKAVFVCSFVAAIIGDMPSQQELSGCLGPTANYPCRYCLVATDEKGDTDFDVTMLGKYHDQVIYDRDRITEQFRAPTTRKAKLAGIGLHDNETLFSTLRGLFPSLDIIRSRPIDAAHSEYSGLSRYVHRLIFQEATSLLTRAGVQQAADIFHHFPTPPGWPRFQSPRAHLDSYSMQDYARGIVVLPIFLRCWLTDRHVKPEIHKYLKSRAKDYLRDVDMDHGHTNYSASELIVMAIWTITRSIMATCSQMKTTVPVQTHITDRVGLLRDDIIAGRKAFQFLCQVQSDTSQIKASNRIVSTVASQAQSEASFSQQSLIRTVPSMRRRQVAPEERINQFLRWKQLPNVHIGLHLDEVAREYGNCTMVFTLIGEDMHKQYKALIYTTNHYSAASTLVNINNYRKTVAFLLAGCYEVQYPRLHDTYQTILKRCPRMSQALDPYLGEDNRIEETDVPCTEISGDINHTNPRAYVRLARKDILTRDDILLNVITCKDITDNTVFLTMLRKASLQDYDTYMVEPGLQSLQWWRKVSFTTTHGDRRTCTTGTFARFRSNYTSATYIARIDGIFTHKRTLSNHIYFCITISVPRHGHDGYDSILKLPYYDITDHRDIVGLPQLCENTVWIVDLVDKGTICMEPNIYFI